MPVFIDAVYVNGLGSCLSLLGGLVAMKHKMLCAALVLGFLAAGSWTIRAAEPSFELTARYILEVVKAFRTAYVLKVVEHAKEGGIKPNEEWQKDSHFIPLPAQFVKAANHERRLKELKAVNSWERAAYIQTGGWDKMPGEDKAADAVARACAEGLAAVAGKET